MNFLKGVIIFFVLFFAERVQGETIPPFERVARQALNYARLEAVSIRSWERNVRKAALLPRLQFGFQRNFSDNLDINLEDSVSVSSSGVTVGPLQQKQVQSNDRGTEFEVKAVWYLDQLLFNRDHLEVSQEARYLAEARQRLLDQVRSYYFLRERLLKELALLQKSNAMLSEQELKKIALAEVTAALDGVTGGWFSKQIQ